MLIRRERHLIGLYFSDKKRGLTRTDEVSAKGMKKATPRSIEDILFRVGHQAHTSRAVCNVTISQHEAEQNKQASNKLK